MKSKRQLQKENTRQRILETAYRIYSLQGFAASTAVIAREAGVSHGTIFTHFQSLSQLLEELVRNFGKALAGEVHELAESSGSIEQLLETHLEILARHEDFYFRLVTERSLLPEEVQYLFEDTQTVIAYHFNRIFEREVKKQTVKDIPVHMYFNMWLGLLHYYLWNKDFFSPGEPLFNRYGKELITTFLKLTEK